MFPISLLLEIMSPHQRPASTFRLRRLVAHQLFSAFSLTSHLIKVRK